MFPFNVFLIIWLLFFCVLYKVLGSQETSAETYVGVNPVFGYFFYNFQISVGNVSNPTFEYWSKIMAELLGKPWSY